MNKDGEAETFKLCCVLTLLPMAKPSSLMPEAGPSCLKPHVGAHPHNRIARRCAERVREASLAPRCMLKVLLSPCI